MRWRLGSTGACLGLVVATGAPAAEQDSYALPSGLEAVLQEVVRDERSPAEDLSFRFVSPDLSAEQDYATTEADLAHLCRAVALPQIGALDPAPEEVVIALADRPLPYGEAAPDAVQFFEAYGLQEGECVWRAF